MVIATSKESRRVLTGSVGKEKSGEIISNRQRGRSTIAQRNVQDDTDGSLDYFEIFWMDWQRIGETALRRDGFRIGFQQSGDSLREARLEEIPSVLI